VLTAAHCVTGVGQKGTISLKDGRTLGLRVVAHHEAPDVAW
jgi:S1-C subfamily serine protease